MAPSVELGAVLSDLENEYERSKKFIDDLYLSLETHGRAKVQGTQEPGQPSSVRPQEEDGPTHVPQDPAGLDPFAAYELTEESSGLSNCSECSTSVPRLPDVHVDGRSPNSGQSPGLRPKNLRRDDVVVSTSSVPLKKGSGVRPAGKPLGIWPSVEQVAESESPLRSNTFSGLGDGPLQRRYSGACNVGGGHSSLESAALAHVLAPAQPSVVATRHRRSSLDFIPAPPAYLRKFLDNTILSGPGSAAGSPEVQSSRQRQQPSKHSSLEVCGSSTAAPLAPRPSPPPPHRRVSSVSYYQPGPAHQQAPGQNQNPHEPQPPYPYQHLALSLESPIAAAAASPTAVEAGGRPLTPRGLGEAAVQANASNDSPGHLSPSQLPPLQALSSFTSPTLPAGAKAVHSSLELGSPGPGGRAGSWSGGHSPGAALLPAAPPVEGQQSPRPRTGRFNRYSQAQIVPTPSTPPAAAAASPPSLSAVPGASITASLPGYGSRRTLSSSEFPDRLVRRMSGAALIASGPNSSGNSGSGGERALAGLRLGLPHADPDGSDSSGQHSSVLPPAASHPHHSHHVGGRLEPRLRPGAGNTALH